MRSVMQHQFSQVPHANIPRSSFDRSHGLKTTFSGGSLVPIFVDEALPGDTFTLNAAVFGRLATPLHPFMDNLHLEFFFFAVPIRLIWDNFKRFFGEQDNPSDSTSFLVPQMTAPVGGFAPLSIYDYMGLPVGKAGIKVNTLHLRAYNLIYNEWFRDENLQVSTTVHKGDAGDLVTDYVLMNRGKRHDYFTSCLPWPQKGPAIALPLGSNAPVKTAGTAQVTGAQSPVAYLKSDGTVPPSNQLGLGGTIAGGAGGQYNGTAFTGTGYVYPSNLYTDLSAATAATINQLRQAFQIQKIYERDARGGTRYTELIRSHFGVTSPDARLQRSEFLGGGHSSVNVNPIAQTSSVESETTPLGNLAAMGTVSNRGVGFSKGFTEHCVLLGLVAARADLTYQDGLNRMWSRQTRWDFYWPALSSIGEQAVLNKEIFCDGTAADDMVFGYQERYAEYRYKPSIITGQFRSSYPESLDTWHLSQDFGLGRPSLNAAFITDNPPIQRVIAVETEPHFLMDCYFRLHCARPMPLYGVPGNIDRF